MKIIMTDENIKIIDEDETDKTKNPKKLELIKGEKPLLIIAFVIAILCDRLFFNVAMEQTDNLFYFTAIFEICFIILFCIFNREKIYKKPLLWVIAVMIGTLCVWNFLFDYMSSYGGLTFVVIPASLMMFTQLTAENHNYKNIAGMVKSWFSGWFIKPFSAIARCVEVISGVLFPKNSATGSVVKKLTAAILITVPLAAVLLFLLSGADKVFGYYVNKIFASFNMYDFILHGFLIAAGFLCFYSFFWNVRYGKSRKTDNITAITIAKKEYKADNLILYVILGTTLTLYILFCAVQFAYLFASAGLPVGITYSEYAREGFAQIVLISGINLIIFGCVLKYGKINKQGQKSEKDIVLKIMLYILIAVTGIMLASGFMRLGLYINTFGMTFLRLISAWFIIYLSLVLILCAFRIIKEKFPLISCCAVLLLFSYNIFGYINPDSFIIKYNLTESAGYYNVNEWTEENKSYVFYSLSDDALNILLDRGLDKNMFAEFLENRYSESYDKYSLASMKLKSALTEISK